MSKLINLDKAVSLYEDGWSQTAIGQYFGVSQWLISHRFKQAGVTAKDKTRKLHKKIYYVMENFFDVIEDKQAWVLGWLLADGFVVKYDNSFGLRLAAKDEDVLIKIRSHLKYSGPILYHISKIKNKSYKGKTLKITSFTLKQKLIEFGITPAKSLSERFPNAILHSNKETITRSFIRGLFEGDGSIIWTNNKLCFQLVGTIQLLMSVQSELMNYLNVNKTMISKNGNSKQNHFALRYNGNVQALKIFDWLYHNSDNQVVLNRKYNKYLIARSFLKGTQCVE